MLEKWVSRVEWVAVICAIAALVLMLVITTSSVLGRHLFASPIPDDIVFNELLMVALVFLPFAYVQTTDQHIHVSLLFDRLSAVGQDGLRLLGTLLSIAFFALLSYSTFADFYSSYEVLAYNEGVLELPEYPFRFLVFLGILLMLVRLVLQCLIQIKRVATNSQ